MYQSSHDAEDNPCNNAQIHLSSNLKRCTHLWDDLESKPHAETGPVNSQSKTPVGDENPESMVSCWCGHWYAIPCPVCMA